MPAVTRVPRQKRQGNYIPARIKAIEEDVAANYANGSSAKALSREYRISKNTVLAIAERWSISVSGQKEAAALCRTRKPSVPIHPNAAVSVALQVAWHLGYASTDGLHVNKEFRAAYKRECAARNPSPYRDAECKRKRHLNNTPAWAKKDAIIAFYRAAKDLGLSVDHEVPLQGRNVCGLHVENNLRLVSHLANSRKSNHFISGPDWRIGPPLCGSTRGSTN